MKMERVFAFRSQFNSRLLHSGWGECPYRRSLSLWKAMKSSIIWSQLQSISLPHSKQKLFPIPFPTHQRDHSLFCLMSNFCHGQVWRMRRGRSTGTTYKIKLKYKNRVNLQITTMAAATTIAAITRKVRVLENGRGGKAWGRWKTLSRLSR